MSVESSSSKPKQIPLPLKEGGPSVYQSLNIPEPKLSETPAEEKPAQTGAVEPTYTERYVKTAKAEEHLEWWQK